MKISLETLRNTKGIGSKTLERIIEQHNIDNNIKAFKSEHIPSDKYKIDKDINLWQGDCLELMSHIPDKSVNMILCDLPYGTTACSWDEVIPFELLWSHYKRIIKDNGAIVLFGSEPFSTKLRMSNLDWYKYDWIWEKEQGSNFFFARTRPLKSHEIISVFYKKDCIYNPQLKDVGRSWYKKDKGNIFNHVRGRQEDRIEKESLGTKRFPKTVLRYNRPKQPSLHPTQKPIELLEYLIKTYTHEDMLVLDNTMGSGSTGVAAKNIGRRFIGIELDKKYFEIAEQRIDEAGGGK